MALTIAELVAQSSGLPHEGGSVVDNPKTANYDWGKAGWRPSSKPNSNTSPSGMTEIVGYVHSYNIMGKPYVPCNMLCRNMQTWVRSKSKGWLRVEDQADQTKRIEGGHFIGDMTGGANPLQVTTNADRSVSFPSPPATKNCHWWFSPKRGQIPGDVDATVFLAEVRVDNPAANVIAGAGTDWWRVGGTWPGGNAASLTGSFVILKDTWRWVACTNLTKVQLEANLPPMLKVVVPAPPPVPERLEISGEIVRGVDGKWSGTIKVG